MSNTEQGVYTFCAIGNDGTPDLGSVEFEGETYTLYTIPYKDIAMVVADVPLKTYRPDKRNVSAHQSVVTKIMKRHSVVPMSFGTIFQTSDDVDVILKTLYEQVRPLLRELTNKIEVGLKVLGRPEWLESQMKGNSKVLELQKGVRGKSAEAGYYDRIQLGEAAMKFISSLQRQIEEEVFKPLSESATAGKVNEPIGEKMLLNSAYLIDRETEAAFDEKVNALYEKWQDKVLFKYTGPWPAYNFVNIRLKVEEEE